MKLKSVFPFLLLLTIQNVIFSQQDFKPGYVITLEDDTLHGFIDYRGDAYNAQNCRYRAEMNSEVTSFSPDLIKAYRFTDGKYYVAKEVEIPNDAPEKMETKYVFLEYLLEGKADVYYLFYSGNKIYYIENNGKLFALYETERIIQQNGEMYFSKDKTYKGLLAYSFKEVPELRDKIQQMNLTQKSLVKISSEYHDKVCPGEECIIYKKKNINIKPAPGAALVYNVNRMQLIYYESIQDIIVSSAIGGGIDCDFWSKGSMERFFFSFKLQFINNKHTAHLNGQIYNWFYDEIDGLYYTTEDRTFNGSFETKNYYIAGIFSYIYPKFKIKPYLGGGVSFYKTYKGVSELVWSDLYGDPLYSPEKSVCNPLISAGIVLELNQYLYCKMESVYNPRITGEILSDRYTDNKTSNFNTSFSLHYVFGKKH